MRLAKKLFSSKKLYDLPGTEKRFVEAMRENAMFHYAHCEDYKRILDEAEYDPSKISTLDDIIDLPFLPTLYFKHHVLQSLPDKKMLIKATSSGTSGAMSNIGFDFSSLWLGLKMVIRVGKYHKLWSLKPQNYIIFGYQPTKENNTAVSKTALGFTFFAPAKSRTFALEKSPSGYKLNWERVEKALAKCAKSHLPMRTIGFPAYTYFLLKDLKERGVHYQMPKGSMVTLGGGWKQFYAQQADKKEFYALVKDVLGIDEDHVIEFFGAVEHPILYTDCRCHHFHIPCYSRIFIRDPDTMRPLKNGNPGLINLTTPMLRSAPILSVMTDDLGVIHDEPCDCGLSTPWLEIIGRVGVADIVTCAAGAEKYLKDE
ncbi:MAG: acyl-protein synthetase [Clostridiales bacterium]|nr:acyl-protein synthetase [Clostridiales bacterium]